MAERKPFLLRLDPEVHEALQRWAADDLRSVNGQIEWILREALRRRGRVRADAGDRVDPPVPGAGIQTPDSP